MATRRVHSSDRARLCACHLAERFAAARYASLARRVRRARSCRVLERTGPTRLSRNVWRPAAAVDGPAAPHSRRCRVKTPQSLDQGSAKSSCGGWSRGFSQYRWRLVCLFSPPGAASLVGSWQPCAEGPAVVLFDCSRSPADRCRFADIGCGLEAQAQFGQGHGSAGLADRHHAGRGGVGCPVTASEVMGREPRSNRMPGNQDRCRAAFPKSGCGRSAC